MRITVARITLMLALIAVISLSGMALVADPLKTEDLTVIGSPETMIGNGPGGKWIACPWPPCMAPCAYPPEPQVVCKPRQGAPVVTSWACCCCGGSEGTRYSPL
jgi:hypothetical protein